MRWWEAEGPEKSFKNFSGNARRRLSDGAIVRHGVEGNMRYVRDMRATAQPARRRNGRAARMSRAVRRQLRGRRRELHPARRRGLGSVPVGDRRRAALARPAPLEHGIDLRIWRARRLLAAPPHVHRGARCRSPSMASPPRSPARPDQVAAMQEAGWEIASHGLKLDRLPRATTPRTSAATWKRRSALHAEVTGERPLGWYHGRTSVNTVRLGRGGGRLPTLLRHL
jgi:hypothetical protein